jgi:catechol 2,3-dioxygenase-like lactoylglutathione lyase family enzyme
MARIIAHSGVLTSADVARSLRFWTEKLGFSVVETFGSPPEFAILRRDGAYQMIGLAKPGSASLRRTQRDGLMDAYFWVDDASRLHDALTANGVELAAPLEKQPYGVLEFMVVDPDGHHIAFGQDLSLNPIA